MELGLSFSGGGVKGAAHIGVLKALEEEKIQIKHISGTSSGSIVATLYACGYKPEEILEIFKKYGKQIKYIEGKNILKIISGLIIKRKIIIKGLNSGKILEKIVKQACLEKNIQNINQIKIPILIPSVDIHTGNIYIFTSKQIREKYSDKVYYINNIEIEKAVKASCSYPGVFEPVKYKDIELVDGGIRENIPWKETKKMGADKVISVVFNEDGKTKCCDNIVDVISNSIGILCHELSNYEINGADYLLKINTPKISLLDTSKIKILYKLGYNQTKNKINEIKRIIQA